jgi:hypothetical protein
LLAFAKRFDAANGPSLSTYTLSLITAIVIYADHSIFHSLMPGGDYAYVAYKIAQFQIVAKETHLWSTLIGVNQHNKKDVPECPSWDVARQCRGLFMHYLESYPQDDVEKFVASAYISNKKQSVRL